MDALNAADWVIITVVGLSMLISLLRGFVREAFSLAGWVLGFVVAMVFADRLAYLLTGFIDDATGRDIVAFALLFALSGFFLWLGERDHRFIFAGTGTVRTSPMRRISC